MRSYLSSHLTIAVHALLVALIVFGSAWYINNSLKEVETKVTANLNESREALSRLALTTDRNGADELTERIIIDCERRAEFEDLLNTLGTASKKDLLTAQQLFESCGSFYAERKALMVAQLEREYAALEDSLSLLEELRDLSAEEMKLKKWVTLIELEKDRSNFLSEQTSIQGEIISLLIEGRQTQARITELVLQARNINESLNVTDAQIDELRLTLI